MYDGVGVDYVVVVYLVDVLVVQVDVEDWCGWVQLVDQFQ